MHSQKSAPYISVISPIYGCAGCLEDLADRVSSCLRSNGYAFELILVDDCSPDGAWARITELAKLHPFLKAIRLSRNFGQHYAIAAGIEKAKGDIVVVMDCDMQDPPEEIPKLVKAVENGAEAAFAQRVDRQDRILKRLGSWAFFRMLSWLTDVRQDHTTANFGAFSRKVIRAINAMPERNRCFPLMIKWTGFKAEFVPVPHQARTIGKSGYSLKKLIRLATDIVLSYSDKPLRLVIRLGLLFALMAFFMVGWTLFRYIHGDTQVAGFTSIIASIWLVGGVSISCMGILGLYIGRLFVDSKRRPYYLIAEELNTKDDHHGS